MNNLFFFFFLGLACLLKKHKIKAQSWFVYKQITWTTFSKKQKKNEQDFYWIKLEPIHGHFFFKFLICMGSTLLLKKKPKIKAQAWFVYKQITWIRFLSNKA